MAYVDLLNAKSDCGAEIHFAPQSLLHWILNANPKNNVPAILGFLNLPDTVWQIELAALLLVIIYPLRG